MDQQEEFLVPRHQRQQDPPDVPDTGPDGSLLAQVQAFTKVAHDVTKQAMYQKQEEAHRTLESRQNRSGQ